MSRPLFEEKQKVKCNDTSSFGKFSVLASLYLLKGVGYAPSLARKY